MAKLTLKMLKNTEFYALYENLIVGKELNAHLCRSLLEVAVILLNNENEHMQSLGYRIVVLYSNRTRDYLPLYDVALNKGLMPIVRRIEKEIEDSRPNLDTFFPQFYSSLSELFRVRNAIYTEQQIDLSHFFSENETEDVSVVAPTSYGKSELFTEFCSHSVTTNICIVVPTKALLAQTKRRLLDMKVTDDHRQIITHPEMFQGGHQKIVAVLTQERLLRFYNKHPNVTFDFVFIDEAHNLLGDGDRDKLLAKVIILQKKRNPKVKIKYLTPFLVNNANLKLRYSGFDTTSFRISESIKTERYYLIDFRKSGELRHYDQYFDQFSLCDTPVPNNEIEFVKSYAAKKNIIYFNSPRKVELFLSAFIKETDTLENDSLERICASIAEFLHKDYLLVEGVRKGIAYHHGSVPDIVKLYIESMFTELDSLQHLICTSTLLEGVNIPAEKIFLMEIKKGMRNLTKSQFRNLAGRVCRFKEIFDRKSGSLVMLEPEIVLVGTDKYFSLNGNLEKFIKNVAQVDLVVKDTVENVLLDEVVIDDTNQDELIESDTFLENIERGVTGHEASYAVTEVGRLCFLNNILEIDVLANEISISEGIDRIDHVLFEPKDVLKAIGDVFIPYLKNDQVFDIYKRLAEEDAQKFYSMLLDWRIRGASYAEMINSFLRYWEASERDEIYVGKWGDVTREDSHKKHWVHIHEKGISEQVNLAIVRIKEEQDFVDNFLLKFVETLNDLGKLDEALYLNIKYGTTDLEKIRLINGGLNSHLATKIVDKYSDYLHVNTDTGAAELVPELLDKMRDNSENDILVFEASLHIGIARQLH